MMILTRSVLFLGALALSISVAVAQETSGPGFGSPNAVENQVEYDFGEAWDAWKQNLKDDFGVVLSVDYTAVMLTANETFDDKNGAGGIARVFGTYDLFNIENGTLVWKFEHRHGYAEPANQLAPDRTGDESCESCHAQLAANAAALIRPRVSSVSGQESTTTSARGTRPASCSPTRWGWARPSRPA